MIGIILKFPVGNCHGFCKFSKLFLENYTYTQICIIVYAVNSDSISCVEFYESQNSKITQRGNKLINDSIK